MWTTPPATGIYGIAEFGLGRIFSRAPCLCCWLSFFHGEQIWPSAWVSVHLPKRQPLHSCTHQYLPRACGSLHIVNSCNCWPTMCWCVHISFFNIWAWVRTSNSQNQNLSPNKSALGCSAVSSDYTLHQQDCTKQVARQLSCSIQSKSSHNLDTIVSHLKFERPAKHQT